MATGTWVDTADLQTEVDDVKTHADLLDINNPDLHQIAAIDSLPEELDALNQWNVDHLAAPNPHNWRETEEYLIGEGAPTGQPGAVPQKWHDKATGDIYQYVGDQGSGESGYTFDGTATATFDTPNWESLGDNNVYAKVLYEGPAGLIPLLPVSSIGTGYIGTATKLEMTDTAPIQGVSVNVGDNTRYIDLDQYIVLDTTFDISFNFKRQLSPSGDRIAIMGNGTTGIYILDNNDVLVTTSGGSVTFVGAMAGKVAGKQCSLRLTRDIDGLISLFVDTYPKTPNQTLTGTMTIDTFGKGAANQSLAPNSALHGIKITDSNGYVWDFPLTEGGTATRVNNVNQTSNKLAWFTNSQIYSYNIVGGVSGGPPQQQPRTGIIFTNGWETWTAWGSAQGPTGSDDRWNRKSSTAAPYAEAVAVGDKAYFENGARDNPSINAPNPMVGTKMGRAYWDVDWPLFVNADATANARSELESPGGNIFLEFGKEYWQGFAVWFPDNADVKTSANTTLVNNRFIQWHNTQPATGNAGWHLKRGGNSLYPNEVVYEVHMPPWNKALLDGTNNNPRVPVEFGKWNTFVLNAYIGQNGTGWAKIWINATSANDTPVFNKTGGTYIAKQHPQLGIYRGTSGSSFNGVSYFEYFYDELRIGDAALGCTFKDVLPTVGTL